MSAHDDLDRLLDRARRLAWAVYELDHTDSTRAEGVSPELGELHRQIGRAYGAIDAARMASDQAARQALFALSEGGLGHPDLGAVRLRTVAAASEQIAGASVALGLHLRESEKVGRVAYDRHDDRGLRAAIVRLVLVQDLAEQLMDTAHQVRRALPRRFGDPFGLDLEWPGEAGP